MTYALVKKNNVVQTGPIPATWRLKDGRCVSSFDKLDPSVWLAEGWLPLTEQVDTIDPSTQQLGASTYTIKSDSVTEIRSAEAKPKEYIDSETKRSAYDIWYAEQDFSTLTTTIDRVAAVEKALLTKNVISEKEITDAAVAADTIKSVK